MHGLGGRHPPALLELAAVGIQLDLSGRFEGAGEPGADHDARRARGEGERDVAGVPHPAVGPDVRAEFAGRGRRLEHGGELRPPDGGHHAGRAHRARPDADLEDVGPGRDQIARALGGDDVAGDDREAEVEAAHGFEGGEHPLLVAVGGVDDEHVDTGGGELLRLAGDVAVDAERRGHAEPPRRVEGRVVDRAAQRAGARRRPGDHAAHPHVGAVVAGAHERVERLARAVGVDGRQRLVGRLPHGRLLLHRDDRGDGLVERRILRQHAEAAASGERGGEPGTGDGVHVGRDDRDVRARRVVGGQIDVETARHARAARDEEDVGVGEVVRGEFAEEAHSPRVRRSGPGIRPANPVVGPTYPGKCA